MFPTKDELIQHLIDKMTNQDIAKIYGTSFQKIIQLIIRFKLDPAAYRKAEKFVVYERWLGEEVVYVGSGVWYWCRRYTKRRNSEHRQLMQDGKLMYKFVGEFDKEEDARKFEAELIQKYKKQGLCKLNKKKF
ncbi:hypothetical protein [Fictibacillus sp. S7]|uniref:hypothetical protein n=1 Tax=Fictibacillus sp. S7 TaxID=2212476 RepID=UPI0010134E23|nr:hypothetical protein [Fictibacillus sp. S7]RXY99175.1 hypothetical protein DMO16_05570 [Fictibacillus sp. S7]